MPIFSTITSSIPNTLASEPYNEFKIDSKIDSFSYHIISKNSTHWGRQDRNKTSIHNNKRWMKPIIEKQKQRNEQWRLFPSEKVNTNYIEQNEMNKKKDNMI